jgi:hypothetical protein
MSSNNVLQLEQEKKGAWLTTKSPLHLFLFLEKTEKQQQQQQVFTFMSGGGLSRSRHTYC